MRRYLVICMLACAPVGSALAELSWYLGAGGSYARYETRGFSSDSGIGPGLPVTDSITIGRFKDSTVGWQAYGGVNFNEYFGVALKYLDSGKAKSQWGGTLTTVTDPGPPPVTTDTAITFDGELQIDGVSVYFVQTIPMSPKVDFAINVGFTTQDLVLDWREVSPGVLAPGSGRISRDDTGFVLGILARYKIIRNFGISGEVEYTTVNFGDLIERPLRFSLNAEVYF